MRCSMKGSILASVLVCKTDVRETGWWGWCAWVAGQYLVKRKLYRAPFDCAGTHDSSVAHATVPALDGPLCPA